MGGKNRGQVLQEKQLGKETGMENADTAVPTEGKKARAHHFAYEKREIVERILRRLADHEIVTQEEGCREEGIPPATYYVWKRKLGIVGLGVQKLPERNLSEAVREEFARNECAARIAREPLQPRVECVAEAIEVIQATCSSFIVVAQNGNVLYMECKGSQGEQDCLKAHLEIHAHAKDAATKKEFEQLKEADDELRKDTPA